MGAAVPLGAAVFLFCGGGVAAAAVNKVKEHIW